MKLCVSYPKLDSKDYELLSLFRKEHDPYYEVIDVHWTMVFSSSCETYTEEKLSKHIQSVSERQDLIEFEANYALVYDDDSNNDYYIFLVPDKGFSAISRLHDELYSDFLRKELRLDIPYVPHLGIATHKDKDYLYELAQQWNKKKLSIKGTINSLTLCSYDGTKVTDLRNYELGKH